MASRQPGALLTTVATVTALLAFAANPVLCRWALGQGAIDAAGFAVVRLVSGAATLLVVAFATGRGDRRGAGNWGSGAALFAYAVCFSFAYLELTVATGSLILFGAVQVTMLGAAFAGGERPQPRQWAGLAAAVGGVVILVAPGLQAPPPLGSALMAVAGIAWGAYSLRGRGNDDPVAATVDNFVRAVPFVLVVGLAQLSRIHATPRGVVLAALSGSVTSGLGYTVWYAALRGLTATRAATVQLTVPVIAASIGVLLLGEHISVRLVIATVAILGGVGVVLAGRERDRGRVGTSGRMP